ncbi:hypothetical protein KPH14_010139 [Odynerus spinipes]|uniref:E3 ubiquitin-protein ligase E3D n=1 Tax=Odynerus spinipes TaxID=1348599 RepID=A0AAD9VTG7_9HYME|nr:hypothetical protein KPH14_010139 [Odynerus spinipes]
MEFITIELRPRLQSCTVFLFMQKEIIFDKVQIKLLEESIILSIGKNVTNISLPNIRIIPSSLSSLNVTNRWICFRLHTQPLESEFGSFQREVVTNAKAQFKTLEQTLNKKQVLFKNSKCTILCTCCKNVCSNNICFKRVLPFPNIDFDPSEWFCCKKDVNFTELLHPNEVDHFYGPFFSILHSNIFKNYIKDKKNILCNRCLLNIGIQFENNSFKIWDSSVDYKFETDQIIIKEASNSLHDFMTVIKSSISDNIFGEIILECLSATQAHYIVIKPMDVRLKLLVEANVTCSSNNICLKEIFVIKILYKYGTDIMILPKESYINAKNYQVTLSMIEAGLNHLLLSTKRFPRYYRTIEDYYIGFINIE